MGTAGVAIVGYLGYVRLFAGQAIGDRPLLMARHSCSRSAGCSS